MSLIERFENKFIPVTESGCWIWTATIGGKFGYKYGKFFMGGKKIGAHRASWIIYNGEIPGNVSVLHKCDTPLCVNPEHLFLGTQKDNIQDMISKGRDNFRPPVGVKHGMSKLTEKEVTEIFNDIRPIRKIALDYEVGKSMVSYIKQGKNWKHLNLTQIGA